MVAILDRSGSMRGSETDVMGAFNKWLEDAKENLKDIDNTKVILVLFDNVVELVYDRTPLRQCSSIDKFTYFVRGSTSLNDAVGQTLSNVPSDSDRVSVLIFTDGYENSSREWNQRQVKNLIEDKKRLDWQIIFSGADMDAQGEGIKIGIDFGSILKRDKSAVHARAYAKTVSVTNFGYLNSGNVVSNVQKSFDDELKKTARICDLQAKDTIKQNN